MCMYTHIVTPYIYPYLYINPTYIYAYTHNIYIVTCIYAIIMQKYLHIHNCMHIYSYMYLLYISHTHMHAHT